MSLMVGANKALTSFAASVKNVAARNSVYIDGSPITLFASCTVAANSTNNPNIAALKNPTPFPIEINEIKFALGSVNPAISPATMGAQFQIGEDLVTNGYIPLWLLDDSRQLYLGETFINTGGATYQGTCNYLWRLNTPLILLPGELLAVSFQNFGLVPTDIDAKVMYAGRVNTMPSAQIQQRVLPTVSFWQGDSLDLSFAAANYPTNVTADTSSDETKLVNAANETMLVTKLVGRLVTLNTEAGSGNDVASDEIQPIIDSMFNVRVRTSHGFELTAGRYVPYRQMFGRDTRSFPGGFELATGEYIIVDVQADQGAIAEVTNGGSHYFFNVTSPVTPQIAMIGERIVSI